MIVSDETQTKGKNASAEMALVLNEPVLDSKRRCNDHLSGTSLRDVTNFGAR